MGIAKSACLHGDDGRAKTMRPRERGELAALARVASPALSAQVMVLVVMVRRP